MQDIQSKLASLQCFYGGLCSGISLPLPKYWCATVLKKTSFLRMFSTPLCLHNPGSMDFLYWSSLLRRQSFPENLHDFGFPVSFACFFFLASLSVFGSLVTNERKHTWPTTDVSTSVVGAGRSCSPEKDLRGRLTFPTDSLACKYNRVPSNNRGMYLQKSVVSKFS